MNTPKINRIIETVILILSILLTLGTPLLFHACGQTDEGTWMSCHWAQQACMGTGALLTVLSVILFLAKGAKAKIAVSFAVIAAAVLAILFPGTLINLCMMSGMRCRSVMRPAVTLISALLIIGAVIHIVLSRKEQ